MPSNNLPPNQSSFNRASPELLPPPTEEVAPVAEMYPEGYTFKDLQEKVKKLSESGKCLKDTAIKNRLLRNMEVDNETERQRGRFKKDEIYIPYHVINDNINKESSSFIEFLVGSKNAAIFKLRNNPVVANLEPLERLFTSAVRYDGYEDEPFSTIDGFQLHGLDYLEVEYDDQKPGYFSFEHLGYENVWYPKNVHRGKFQLTPILVKNCQVTKAELEGVPDINPEQLNLLFKDVVKNDPEKEFIDIQKVYYRIKGVVNICWMNHEKSTDFLRIPKPLFLGRYKVIIDELTGIEVGRQMIYENFYNIVPFPYSITENKNLIETLGRARFDESTQEAVSSMVSSIVNGYHRASGTMWAPKNPTSTGQIEQLDLVLEKDRGLSQPIDFFNPPYPDEAGMSTVNALLTQNKAETSQINLAVGNRSDYASRKTAKEIDVAQQMKSELKTIQVILFSKAWKEVLNIAFLIFKSQIELGMIKPVGFDKSVLAQDIVLQAAGETEVIQRQETLANLQNIWPVIATTPAAPAVLEDILRLMVPSSADKYIAAMKAADPKLVAQGLAAIIQAIAKEHPEVIPQESYEQLGALIQAANTPGPGEPQGEQQNEQPQQTVGATA
jgi:hypothetical protein